jgi:tetratricopeptide (TPR) repeat protein
MVRVPFTVPSCAAGRWLCLLACAAVLVLPPDAARAQTRATPEQLRDLAKDADKLLADPVANRAQIVGVLIKPGARPDAELVGLLQARLKQATSAEEKAAVHFLLGKTYYWGAFRQFRQTRDRKVFSQDVVGKVVGEGLAAFEAARAVPGGQGDSRLQQDTAADLRDLFGSNLYGEALSPELKHEAVTRFIDVLEKSEQGTRGWPADARAKAYRNLGIAERLAREIPAEMPADREELDRTMKQVAAISPKEAVRFAVALEAKQDLTSPAYESEVWDIFEVYRAAADPRALPWLKRVAERFPNYCLPLYVLSRDAEPDLPVQERDKYLEAYVSWAEASVGKENARESPISACDMVVSELLREGDYARVLRYAERGLKQPPALSPHLASLYYAKGKSLQELRQPEQALAAFELCIKYAPFSPSGPRLKERAEKAVQALQAEKRP